MKVGFLQYRVAFGEPEANRARVERMIGDERFDLLVLPELAFSGYFMPSRAGTFSLAEPFGTGPSFALIRRIAQKSGGAIVFGFPEQSGDKVFNSAAAVLPGGECFLYRKVHLFHLEKDWFDPGDLGFTTFEFRGVKIGVMICFDWTFPESMRTLALMGTDIVCHPSNLVLPYCQDAMVTRCLENRIFAITCNRTGADRQGDEEIAFTGKSQITGCRGEVITQAGADEESLTFVEIEPQKARDKMVTPANHVLADRRPQFYRT